MGLEKEVIQTSKRIAEAYVQLGQLSSAILEYETILQRFPGDKDAMAAMAQIESKANNLTKPAPEIEMPAPPQKSSTTSILKKLGVKPVAKPEVDDGRQLMYKYFVEAKLLAASDFDACWPAPSLTMSPVKTVEPFIHVLAEKQIMPVDKSLKVLADRSRLSFVPLDRYDLDIDLARTAPRDVCRRWCVMPFDRMSKSVMIATANPFNKQALMDLEDALQQRLLLYLSPPTDLIRILSKVFR